MRADAISAQGSAIYVFLFGLIFLLIVKLFQGILANVALESRFSLWLSDRTVSSGFSFPRIFLSTLFVFIIFGVSLFHFTNPGEISWLTTFPTDPNIRLTSIYYVELFFDTLRMHGESLFSGISYVIRVVLDGLEILLVSTPWPVIAAFIILLTGLCAGFGASLASACFLSYMGFLGFWDKAMTTLALLGTAALLSIFFGIPLGLFCARRPRFYSLIRPIMDFMQTMPSFVFMIPVIAFFSVGKPAAVITTMIFGGTPVVRLTVLGMRGVPESIREAAIAYGASRWYLLLKVDLPLASPSIFAGINQTIMLSLAMVVVASLIGAKGLGEDVLEALQYSSVGQGILAGFAILFCAMILNRIVQGKRD